MLNRWWELTKSIFVPTDRQCVESKYSRWGIDIPEGFWMYEAYDYKHDMNRMENWT